MRKLVFGMLAVAILAAPAMAELSTAPHTGPLFTATKVGINDPVVRASTAVYDSLGRPGTFPFFAASPAVGALGYDDYDTISGVNFTQAQFVGGMTATFGQLGSAAVMWFEFYTSGFAFATSYGVIIPQAGNFIWTIGGLTGITFPHTGFHQIVANSTYTGGGAFSTTISGQWFTTSTAALVLGSNVPGVAGGSTTGGAPLHQTFRFDVPEPTTIGLLGAGMLLVLRRRR